MAGVSPGARPRTPSPSARIDSSPSTPGELSPMTPSKRPNVSVSTPLNKDRGLAAEPSFLNSNISAEEQTRHLFKSKTINDIKQLELITRKDIEEKKSVLRGLIGNRYREIISASDVVTAMQTDAKKLQGSARSLSETFERLKAARIDSKATKLKLEERAKARREKDFARKIKFLVDTPEDIWFSLEKKEFLIATTQYLTAESVHSALKDIPSSADEHLRDLHKSMSFIIDRQWQLISGFPAKIVESIRQTFASGPLLTREYANSLTSLLFVGNFTPETVFSEFVAAKGRGLARLRDECQKAEELNDVITAVTEIAKEVKAVVTQVAILFTRADLFDIEPTPTPNEDKEDAVAKSIKTLLASQSALEKFGSDFQMQIKSLIDGKTILQGVTTFSDVIKVQAALQRELSALFQEDYLQEELSWAAVTKISLNRPFDLWRDLFHEIFLRHVSDISQKRLSTVSIEADVSDSLKVLSDPKGSKTEWFPFETDLNENFWRVTAKLDPNSDASLKLSSNGVSKRAHVVLKSLNNQITAVLNDASTLLSDSELLKSWPTLAEDRSALKSTLVALAKEAVERILKFIATQIETLKKASSVTDEQCHSLLFLARLGQVFLIDTPSLASLLGNEFKSSMPQSPSIARASLASITPVAIRVYYSGVAIPISEMLTEFRRSVSKSLNEGDWKDTMRKRSWMPVLINTTATDPQKPSATQTQEFVPFLLSAYITRALFDICAKLLDAFSFAIDPDLSKAVSEQVVLIIVDEFSKYNDGVVKGEGAQKGLVQLWFDLRVILDIFSHRKIRNTDLRKILNDSGLFLRVPGVKEPTTVTNTLGGEDDMTELMLWTKMTEGLLAKIKGNLDAVDVLFYEPHIQREARQSFQRTFALFGPLSNHTVVFDASKESSAPQSAIAFVPPPQRFKLLPIAESQSLDKLQHHLPTSGPNSPTVAAHSDVQTKGSFIGAMVGGILGISKPKQ